MPASSQSRLARELLAANGMARLAELKKAGVTAATMSRLRQDGAVVRLARGLYQLADAALEANHSLAEAAKRVPRGVVCLVSALAFHGLTDQLPKQVWLAIARKDWSPTSRGTHLRIVRYTERLLDASVETHVIEGVSVHIFGIAKTIADCFRYRNKIGLSVALEGLREALLKRRTTPAEIARHAAQGRVAGVVRPYLEALAGHAA